MGNGLKGNKNGLSNEAGSVLNLDEGGSYNGQLGIGSRKVIGNSRDASAGKLKTYKTKVASLNTGEINSRGGSTNLADRNDL